jgi:hypothetical protein
MPLFLPWRLDSRNTLANPLLEAIQSTVYPIKRPLWNGLEKKPCDISHQQTPLPGKTMRPPKFIREASSVQ